MPRSIVYTAHSIPAAILAQFFLAGLALFQDTAVWAWHAALGFLLLVPIAVVLLASFTVARVRPLRWWSIALVTLYCLQVLWIIVGQGSGSGILQALHPFNAGLLLAASLVLVDKTA